MKERISEIPVVVNSIKTESSELSASDIAALIDDPAALRALAKGKLVQIIANTDKPTISLVPAIKELLDRVDGKASQSLTMDVVDKRMDKLPIEKLLCLAAMLDEPVIIAPIPNKLEIEN